MIYNNFTAMHFKSVDTYFSLLVPQSPSTLQDSLGHPDAEYPPEGSTVAEIQGALT